NDDNVTTKPGTAVDIPVLGNDTDPDGDPLSVATLGKAARGTVSLNNNVVTYTPAAGFNGIDTFNYTVTDGQAQSDFATVTVQVSTGANNPPTAVNDSARTFKNTPVIIPVLANDSDPEGDVIKVSSVNTPANGTAVLNTDGTITYTPKTSFAGSDSFTYLI